MQDNMLFIYGSLKRNFGNYRVMEDYGATYTGDAVTAAAVWDLEDLGSFPGLVKGNFFVAGELFKIKPGTLDMYDRFEGAPDFYRRVPIRVFNRGTAITVWGYQYNPDEDGAEIFQTDRVFLSGPNTICWKEREKACM